MFQELIKIAEEVYSVDRTLGIKLGKCLEGLGKKVAEHNKESKQMYDKIKHLELKIRTLETKMRRKMH
jgi:hypothetical protein